MKRILILILLVNSAICSQNFKLGFGYQTYLSGNDTFLPIFIGGLKIHGKYKLNEKYALLTNTSLMLLFDDYTKKGQTYQADNYYVAQFEESFLYYLFKSDLRPYMGAGISYYIFRTEGRVHPKTFNLQTNEQVIGEFIDGSFGFLINTGLSITEGFFAELKLLILNPTLVLDVIKDGDIRQKRKVNRTINLNSIFFSFGYEFTLF